MRIKQFIIKNYTKKKKILPMCLQGDYEETQENSATCQMASLGLRGLKASQNL